MMRKSRRQAENDAKTFKVPGSFRKLWNGDLFGKRKDEVILRILKLGGKGLLMSRCGLRLDRDTIDVAPAAPSMKLLLEVLRQAEAEQRKVEESSANAEAVLAHPEDYNIERTVIPSRTGPPCETEMWTRKQPSAKPRKRAK
jgi:hypothetical protein